MLHFANYGLLRPRGTSSQEWAQVKSTAVAYFATRQLVVEKDVGSMRGWEDLEHRVRRLLQDYEEWARLQAGTGNWDKLYGALDTAARGGVAETLQCFYLTLRPELLCAPDARRYRGPTSDDWLKHYAERTCDQAQDDHPLLRTLSVATVVQVHRFLTCQFPYLTYALQIGCNGQRFSWQHVGGDRASCNKASSSHATSVAMHRMREQLLFLLDFHTHAPDGGSLIEKSWRKDKHHGRIVWANHAKCCNDMAASISASATCLAAPLIALACRYCTVFEHVEAFRSWS